MENPSASINPAAIEAALQQVVHNSFVSTFITQLIQNIRSQKAAAHPNPLTRKGCKYFSQNDEDGILLEILHRLEPEASFAKTFIEFGVGNGLENNTLILLMHGWRGFWAGGEDLALDLKNGQGKLGFTKGWINRETALTYVQNAIKHNGTDKIDVFSIDLDGMDIHILEALLTAGHRPKVLVCEYNGKFPPPVESVLPYNPDFRWNGSDYFGASLQSYANMLSRFDYQPVACNITGANAFFVQKAYASLFKDVPGSIKEIFVPADYGLVLGMGHPTWNKTINHFI